MTLSLFLNPPGDGHSRGTEVAAAGKLVLGCESTFLDQLLPRVKSESLQLNLSAVDQIDAAGIAAILALYRTSSEAGHRLTVVEPSGHVHELLRLVGLEHLLIAEEETFQQGLRTAELTAA